MGRGNSVWAEQTRFWAVTFIPVLEKRDFGPKKVKYERKKLEYGPWKCDSGLGNSILGQRQRRFWADRIRFLAEATRFWDEETQFWPENTRFGAEETRLYATDTRRWLLLIGRIDACFRRKQSHHAKPISSVNLFQKNLQCLDN